MLKLNNKGQSLVLFIVLLPILLLVIVLVVDVGTIMTSKQDLNNINYMMVDYGLSNLGKENLEEEIRKYIVLNDSEIDNMDIKSLIAHIFNIKDFEIVSEYKGTIINDKKSIERIK